MENWARVAENPFAAKELAWLEELNPEKASYYRWLFLVTHFAEPEVALELGVCRAQASAHIAAGGARVMVGVDKSPWQPEFDQAVAAIRERGHDYRFILGDTTAPTTRGQVAEIVKAEGPIGLLFIDSNHTYNQAMGEFLAYRDYLEEGAVIAMDDLHAPEEVFTAFQEIPGDHLDLPGVHVAHWPVQSQDVGFGAIIYRP